MMGRQEPYPPTLASYMCYDTDWHKSSVAIYIKINCSSMGGKYCYAEFIKDMLLSAYLILIWHKNGSE